MDNKLIEGHSDEECSRSIAMREDEKERGRECGRGNEWREAEEEASTPDMREQRLREAALRKEVAALHAGEEAVEVRVQAPEDRLELRALRVAHDPPERSRRRRHLRDSRRRRWQSSRHR